jgi:hypothetical protein
MIQDGVAASILSRVDDSAGIIHEGGGIEGDGERTDLDQIGSHGIFGSSSLLSRSQASVVLDGSSDELLVQIAILIDSSVGILSLSLESSPGHDVDVSVPLPSSSASLVADLAIGGFLRASVRAVDDELLREKDLLSILDGILGLDVSSGAEGPAGSALSLVLHGGDDSLGSPVEAIRNRGHGERGFGSYSLSQARLSQDLRLDLLGKVESVEIFSAHVRELVEGIVSTGILGIERGNSLLALLEISEGNGSLLLG